MDEFGFSFSKRGLEYGGGSQITIREGFGNRSELWEHDRNEEWESSLSGVAAGILRENASVVPFLVKEGGYRSFSLMGVMLWWMDMEMGRVRDICWRVGIPFPCWRWCRRCWCTVLRDYGSAYCGFVNMEREKEVNGERNGRKSFLPSATHFVIGWAYNVIQFDELARNGTTEPNDQELSRKFL